MDPAQPLTVPPALVHLYATLDLRVISALAKRAFAQMLEVSTSYFNASYAYFHPSPRFRFCR